MAEYIDRDAIYTAFANACTDVLERASEIYYIAGFSYEHVIEILDNIPAADVAPVVRCKDCEYAERYERTDGTAGYYCGHPQNSFTYGERWDRVLKPVKETDGFCSYGARKDDSAT